MNPQLDASQLLFLSCSFVADYFEFRFFDLLATGTLPFLVLDLRGALLGDLKRFQKKKR